MALTTSQRRILELIAGGHSYDQILGSTPGASYGDIFQAAQAAIDEIDAPSFSVEKVRKTHPNAYRPWNEHEDERLKGLVLAGKQAGEIAELLGRTRGAIQARLVKLFLDDAIG